MKFLILIFELALAIPPQKETFESWIIKYEKDYNSAEEVKYRKDVWIKNLEKIEKHNYEAYLGKSSYYLAINQFSDLTTTEFRTMFLAPTVTDKPPVTKCKNKTFFRLRYSQGKGLAQGPTYLRHPCQGSRSMWIMLVIRSDWNDRRGLGEENKLDSARFESASLFRATNFRLFQIL